MSYYTVTSWVDNTTALSASNLNHLEAGVAAAVPRTGTVSTDIIDYNLSGSTDVGISAQTHAVNINSAVNVGLFHNAIFDGTNNKFQITESFPAYELVINGSGVAARKSTSNGTAGGTITWGSYTFLFT